MDGVNLSVSEIDEFGAGDAVSECSTQSDSICSNTEQEMVSDNEDRLNTRSEEERGNDSDSSCISSCSDPDSVEQPLQSTSSQQVSTDSEVENIFDILFMSVAQRHNMTYACQGDVLKLMSMLVPNTSMVPAFAVGLRNKYVCYSKEVAVHLFCGHCLGCLFSEKNVQKPSVLGHWNQMPPL